ncbi:hypothetical protein [Telmatospirillum sp.]|uniref:hypothetical protein n=1 Tax=Telmatospirillum sp. TaxID=2079197 RepID=UPI002850947E|nr:hypothetical protein [Telmatospirillum sp.]MDR3436946.1 hypothetical protein [Telmatospirillum sp.]
MTDDTKTQPTMTQRPQQETPEPADQRTPKTLEKMPAGPILHAARGRKPLFGN